MKNYKILANAAKCLSCGDEIYSAHTHDFKQCSCGNVFVDGGMRYLRQGIKDKSKYEDLSITIDESVFEKCIEALNWCDKTKRNNLGKVCAIFRALRDTGFLDNMRDKNK